MIEEERSPALRRRAPSSGHVLGNRGLAYVDAELEEFSMDARSAPERICQAHLADQLPNFERHLGPADSSSRFPTPKGAKAGAMPADNRLGAHNGNRLENARGKSVKQYEDEAIEPAKGRALGCVPAQYVQLLTKRNDLCLKRPPGPEEVEEHPLEQIQELEHPTFIARFGPSGQAGWDLR